MARDVKLYEKNEWKALLHYNNGLNIKDKKFIISKKFSLQNELYMTIEGFYISKENYKNINEHPQCKFPSRLLFIKHELNILDEEFPKIDCLDLKTYILKAPADKIFLTYASENVKNPSSMMGHTFLKYSGKNYQGREVEHAVTFYTVLDSLNLFKLTYQNIFSGMRGMFALQPYKKIVEQYTNKENRNVWEYELALSEYKRRLIYYHIWELKDVDMKYFFSSYNCSTVIYYALSLANSKVYDAKSLWVTPLDTVKLLYKYDLIKNSKLSPSREWLIKMTVENLERDEIERIKEIIEYKDYVRVSKLDFYSLKLLEAYSYLKYQKKEIRGYELATINDTINKAPQNIGNYFDISKYKSPNKTPEERQFKVAYQNTNKEDYINISFLPASHLLNDNNREYFTESELKIGYLSVLLNKKSIELEEFTLYGMKSYVPYDSLTEDLSYQFELAMKKEYSKDMEYLDTLKIDGGIGMDFLFLNDINVFAMLNIGVGYNKNDNLHIFFNPQVGGMVYEIFSMKSLAYYEPLFINNKKVYNKYVLNHNIFFSKDYTFYFNLEKIRAEKKYNNYELGLSIIF